MTEKHVKYSMAASGTISNVLYSLVQFIRDSGQATMQLATDLDAADEPAIYDGTVFKTAASITGPADLPTESYIVLEPVAAYPGGGRWQVQLKFTGGDLDVRVASLGGWDSSLGDDGFTGVTPISAWGLVMTSAPNVADFMYWSTSDLDTYNAGADKYTYLRLMAWDASDLENAKWQESFYVGGYAACEPASDTRPCCLLVGAPATSAGWGLVGGLNQINADVGHTGLEACGIFGCASNKTLNRSGGWVNTPLYLETASATLVGQFGPNTMLDGHANSRTDGATDTAAEYIVAEETMQRWKPSA